MIPINIDLLPEQRNLLEELCEKYWKLSIEELEMVYVISQEETEDKKRSQNPIGIIVKHIIIEKLTFPKGQKCQKHLI